MNQYESTPEVDRHENDVVLTAAERYAAHPLASLETYKYFNQKGEALQASNAEFLHAIMNNVAMDAPSFTYDGIDVEQLLLSRESLTEILAELTDGRDLTIQERITRENVTNRLHEIGIMLLTKAQSETAPDDPNYKLISYQLGENMREVYGAPEKELFRGILGLRMSQLRDVETRPGVPESVSSEWNVLQDEFSDALPIEHPYSMKPETFVWYKKQLEERMHEAREAVKSAILSGEITLDADGNLDAQAIVKATQLVLDTRGFEDWKAQLTSESGIDTTQVNRTINIPASRVMPLEEFDAVIGSHEVDQHVARRENGDSGVLELAGTGANGYLAMEEGNGKINEDLVKGVIDNKASAFAHFLNGGLALGLDNNSAGRNFRETCELVWRINFVADFLEGKHSGEETDKVNYISNAITQLRRIFRGTDGSVRGVVFTKDAVTYYQGGVEIMKKWDKDMELPETERINEHRIERSAKIDSTRSDHRVVAIKSLQSHPRIVR